jgi:hypothetical protein
MARLPVLKKRRSRKQRALDLAKSAAKAWTAVKVTSAGGRAARKGAKAYGVAKGAKMVGRPLLKVAAVPVVVGGGVVVWRQVQKGSGTNGASADKTTPAGPVSSADASSEPARSNEVRAS